MSGTPVYGLRARHARPAPTDRRGLTITLADALILGQVHRMGGAAPDAHVTPAARPQLDALVRRGWLVFDAGTATTPARWRLTADGADAWAATGTTREVSC